MAGLFQTRERRALVVFLLLAGVFVAGLLLAERRARYLPTGQRRRWKRRLRRTP